MSAPEELRLINEIAHKLEYAIKTAQKPAPVAYLGSGLLDPALLRSVHALYQPQGADQLYERIMDLVLQVTGAERGFFMLVEEGRKLRYKVGRSIDRQTLEHESDTSRTVIKSVMQTGTPVLVGDGGPQKPLTSSSIRGLRLRSIACAPLLFPGTDGQRAVGGVIYIDARALVTVFDQTSLDLLMAIADQAVTAMTMQSEQARWRGIDPDAGKLQQNFERLLEVGRAISSTLVLDDLLGLVMEKVLELTRADRGFLMLLEEGTSEPAFKIGLTWNKQDGPARRLRRLTEDMFVFSRTVCRRALEERGPVVLQDVMADGGGDASLSMVEMELSSVMVAPLLEKGQVLGLIYVDSKASNKSFGESDVRLFEALAGQAAIGLKNALLYSRVAEQKRVESEIEIAAEMQRDLCPKHIPRIQGLELCGHMAPAREVGGDYYDFVPDTEAPEQVLSIVVGDVSGKGLGAGMVAVMARCFLRSMLGAYGPEDPSRLLGYLHATLQGELKPGKFMTMLLLVWEAARSTLRYAAAGHENLIVWRAATRRAEVIPSGGSPLGIPGGGKGPTPNAEVSLAPGDTVVLYTDGVTEAMNPQDEEYDLQRLVALVQRCGGQAPAAMQAELLRELEAHRRGREPNDDVTLVILRRV